MICFKLLIFKGEFEIEILMKVIELNCLLIIVDSFLLKFFVFVIYIYCVRYYYFVFEENIKDKNDLYLYYV